MCLFHMLGGLLLGVGGGFNCEMVVLVHVSIVIHFEVVQTSEP